MKQFGMPPLSTKPTISEQFFHDHPLCPNFKNENPTPDFMVGGGGGGGGGNYVRSWLPEHKYPQIKPPWIANRNISFHKFGVEVVVNLIG